MKENKKTTPVPKWALLAIIALTVVVFVRAIFNDFVSLDDDTYVIQNPLIRNFSIAGIKTIFSQFYFTMYHPLTILSYWFEYTLFGLNPLPYHLLNVVLHLFNVFLAFRLAEALSGRKLTAVVVAILFAIHPMHVESVAWVSERKDVLYAFFYLFSLLYYVHYLKNNLRVRFYLIAVFFFMASLLSKPAAITLPVLLFAFDYYTGRKITKKAILEKIPLLIMAVVFGLMAMTMVEEKTYNFLSVSYSLTDRILLICYNVAFYWVKLIAPLNLSAIYYYPNPNRGALPWMYYAAVPFLLLIGYFIFKIKSYRKEWVFALLFFFITVSVMLQIVPNGLAVVCDRYTYIPYWGFFYILGQWMYDQSLTAKKKTVFSIFFIVVIFFSALSWHRIGVWRDGETLMTDVIKKSPDIFHCYWMRGNIRNNKGNLKGALQDYNKTIEYDPTYHQGYSDRSTVRLKMNDLKGALEDLNTAIRIDSTIPRQYNNRAAVFEQMGNPTAALQDYNKAIQLNPQLVEAYINRSMLRAKSGDIDGALADIEKSIVLSPTTPETYSTRGNIRSIRKDYKGAVDDYNHSLELRPNDTLAYYNLGLLHVFMNDTVASCPYFQKAAQLGSRKAGVLVNKYCH